MKIGDVMVLKVEDTAWAFALTFGEYRGICDELETLKDAGDTDKLLDRQLQVLREKVVRVEGLTGADDQPVQWDPAMVDQFNPLQIMQILETLMSLGTAQSPTTSAAT